MAKKNIIMLVVAVLLLGGLAGVYFWSLSNEGASNADETAPELAAGPESINLIERDQADIATADFTSETGTLSLVQQSVPNPDDSAVTEGEWFLSAYPNAAIDQTAALDMARGGFQLIADRKIADTVDNPAEYGLNPPVMAAAFTYTDGTTKQIFIGNLTPDKNRYYLTVEGDPALYLLYTYYGDRYFKTESDMADRTLIDFTAESYEYVLINERGQKPIEFDFIGTEAERAQRVEEFGAANIAMVQPYHGRELYYPNFKSEVLDKLAGFALGGLIEFSAGDLASYGLAEPSLEFWFKNAGEELHLFFGDQTEDGQVYVKYADRPQVFTAPYASVSALYGVNPMSFIERFLALVNIDDCESIDIAYAGNPDRNMNIVINTKVLPPAEGGEEGQKVIEPTVNGKAVEEDPFREIYRLLIGFTADMEVEADVSAAPVFTVTYNMVEGEPIVVSLYEYAENPNFYAAKRSGEDFVFATNKQSVEMFFERVAEELAAA